MKKFILACAVIAFVLFVQAQNGLAYSNVHEGCTSCHLKNKLHAVPSHATCTSCHENPNGAQDVASATCAVCHPARKPGECSLIKQHVRIMKNCASCHGTTLSVAGIGISTAGPACTSCHTDCTSTCPAATVLGEKDPRLASLRHFRDTVLSKNALGRHIIHLYYTRAETINAALENHPKLKAFAHTVLVSFISAAELFK